MAPKRTWTAWVVDPNGNRIVQSGDGDMPAGIQQQMLQEDEASSSAGSQASVSSAPAVAPAPSTPASADVAAASTTSGATNASAVPPGASTTSGATNTSSPPANPPSPAVPTPAPAPVAPPPVQSGPVATAAAVAVTDMTPSIEGSAVPSSMASKNPAMIALGAGLIAAMAIFAVAAVLIYRRRLNRKDAAVRAAVAAKAAMFLDLGDKDVTPPKAAVKARKIGEPQLINTTASEALRGAIVAGPRSTSPKAAKDASGKKSKPKLSIAMYRTSPAGIGAPTIMPLSPSPRTARGTPAVHDVNLASPIAGPYVAPSPRRLTSFDCAPSPLPTDGRQRLARFDYSMHSDALPSPSLAPPRPNGVVGHRRTASRGSINSRASTINRQAVYGQHGLNRISISSNGDASLLSIPVSSRYSFDRDRWSGDSLDVHGMI